MYNKIKHPQGSNTNQNKAQNLKNPLNVCFVIHKCDRAEQF